MPRGKILVCHDEARDELTVQLHWKGVCLSAPPVPFADPLKQRFRSALRWYLEAYLRHPIGIYPDKATRIEQQMAGWGGVLFDRLFSEGEGGKLYQKAKDEGLHHFDFQVHAHNMHVQSFPWELLFDTREGFWLALRCASFSRVLADESPISSVPGAARIRSDVERHDQEPSTGRPGSEADEEDSGPGARQNQLESETGANGDSFATRAAECGKNAVRLDGIARRLHVLMVIARPAGRHQVFFRSLAPTLVTQLQQACPEVYVEALRPPTLFRLQEALSRTRDDGSAFFDVVHFDGHGGYGFDLASGRKIDVEELLAEPQGTLLLEQQDGSPLEANAETLRATFQACSAPPFVVVNVCHSGLEATEGHDAQQSLADLLSPCDDASAARVRERVQDQTSELSALARTLLAAGVPGVLTLPYLSRVDAAATKLREFYRQLATGANAEEAVSASRLELVKSPLRSTRFGPRALQDWIVPIYYHRAPFRLHCPTSGTAVEPAPGHPGRSHALMYMDRALRREGKAGIMLTGLCGIGKTTLALDCARWLSATQAHQTSGGIFIFTFEDTGNDAPEQAPALTRLVNEVGNKHFGPDFAALPEEQALELVRGYLAQYPCLLILDHLEAAGGAGGAGSTSGTGGMGGTGGTGGIKSTTGADGNGDPRGIGRKEPPSGADLPALRTFLKEICPPRGATRVVVTSCRDEAWLDLPLERLELDGLDEEGIAEIVTSAITAVGIRKDRSDPVWQRDLATLVRECGGNPRVLHTLLAHLAAHSPAEIVEALEAGAGWLDMPAPDSRTNVDGPPSSTGELSRCLKTPVTALRDQTRAPLTLVGHCREWAAPEFLEVISRVEEAPLEIRGMKVRGWQDVLKEASRTGLVADRGDGAAFRVHPLLPWVLGASKKASAQALEVLFRHVCAEYAMTLRQPRTEVAETASHQFQLYRATLTQALLSACRARIPEEMSPLFHFLYSQLTRMGHSTEAAELSEVLELERRAIGHEPSFPGRVEMCTAEDRFYLEVQVRRASALLDSQDFEGAEALYENVAGGDAGQRQGGTPLERWGRLALDLGDLENAETLYKRSLETEQRNKNNAGIAVAHYQLANVALARRAFGEAEERLGKSLELHQGIGLEADISSDYHMLGRLCQARKDFGRAESFYRKSLEIRARAGDNAGEAETDFHLGGLMEVQDAASSAEAWYRKSLEKSLACGDEFRAAAACCRLGALAQKSGALDTARTWYQQGLELELKLGHARGAGMIYRQLGAVAREQKDLEQAELWCSKSLELLTALRETREVAHTCEQLGLLCLTRGDGQACARYFVRAFRFLQAHNETKSAGATLGYLRDAHQKGIVSTGHLEAAWREEAAGELPQALRELVLVAAPPGRPGQAFATFPPHLLQLLSRLQASGLNPDQIISTMETFSGRSFPPELKQRLREEMSRTKAGSR